MYNGIVRVILTLKQKRFKVVVMVMHFITKIIKIGFFCQFLHIHVHATQYTCIVHKICTHINVHVHAYIQCTYIHTCTYIHVRTCVVLYPDYPTYYWSFCLHVPFLGSIDMFFNSNSLLALYTKQCTY